MEFLTYFEYLKWLYLIKQVLSICTFFPCLYCWYWFILMDLIIFLYMGFCNVHYRMIPIYTRAKLFLKHFLVIPVWHLTRYNKTCTVGATSQHTFPARYIFFSVGKGHILGMAMSIAFLCMCLPLSIQNFL